MCADSWWLGAKTSCVPGGSVRPGEALDVDRDALAAPDVAQELAKARPDIEHDIVWFDVALEEMRAEDAPDGVLGVAIGLGKTRGVERVETQRMTRGFSMRRIS